MCHLLSRQRIRKYRKRLLRSCDNEINLGDEGPYQGLVEALQNLIDVIKPSRFPSGNVRRRARALKSILKGVYTRIKESARRRMSGVGQLLQTEIEGHGGLSVFRRLDAACLPSEPKVEYRPRGGSGRQRGPRPRGGRGRGAARGRGGGRHDARDMTCFNCYQTGHMRHECPEAGSSQPSNNAT